jgi:ParB family chromosome partitioning protein
MAPKSKNRLGKGFEALMDEEGDELPLGNADGGAGTGSELKLSLDLLKANPGQPRKHFDEAALGELAASIKAHGVIEPIIVDKAEDGTYTIVAGERRSRAAAIAGLREVPVIVRNYTQAERLEVALIENVQRSDLNPIEEAAAYKQLMESGGLSQDEAAVRLGKNRSTVANALRLLKLSGEAQEAMKEGRISPGHGRAILSVLDEGDRDRLFKEIVDKGLSVRETESRAAVLNGAKKPKETSPQKARSQPLDPQLADIQQRFIDRLGTKVTITGDLSKGSVQVEYYSMEDLDRLLNLMG